MDGEGCGPAEATASGRGGDRNWCQGPDEAHLELDLQVSYFAVLGLGIAGWQDVE